MKKTILADVTIECDPPYFPWARTAEEQAKYYESWVKEFNAFIRDHRSQDDVRLNVQRKYEDQCEFCHSVWETDSDGSPVCCNKAIDEWEAAKKATAE